MLPECCHKPLDTVENTSVQKEKINTVSRDLTIELVRCKEIKKNIQADKLSREEEIRLLGIDAPELRMCNKLKQDERETHIAGQLLMELGRKAQKFMISVVPPETNITFKRIGI